MNFRLRSPKGVENFRGYDGNTSLSKFRALVAEKTEIKPEYQKFLSGYPPKEILPTSESDPISKFFANGDTITVEQSASPISGILSTDASAATPVNTNTKSADLVVAATQQNIPTAHSMGTNTTTSTSVPVINAQQNNTKPTHSEPARISPGDGVMLKRTIPDDNSCLFNAVAYVLEKSKSAADLRKIIADVVLADPINYSEAILGQSPAKYAQWITHKDHWGGAIELAILAQFYRTEIVAFDVINVRSNCFGEGQNYTQRACLVYDGIHYDSLAFNFMDDGPQEMDITLFSPHDQVVASMALEFVKKLHAKGQYTDTNAFKILCTQCQKVLVGEKAATEHAKTTGHTNFVEHTK
jgi:ubiquitin thioesterase OTU1